MGWKKLSLVCLAFVGMVGAQNASAVGPKYLDSTVHTFSAAAGKTTTLDLNTLLKPVDPAWVMLWGFLPPNPDCPRPAAYVKVNDKTGKLEVTPPARTVDNIEFCVAVNKVPSDDGGDSKKFRVTIYADPEWTVPTVALSAMEDVPFTFDLNSVAMDPAGKPLKFALNDPTNKFPSVANGGWVDVSDIANGKLSGTPRRKDVGTFSGFAFNAKSESGGSVDVAGSVKVDLTFKGPKWVAGAMTLPDAVQSTTPYSQILSSGTYLKYAEAEPLTFKILPGATNAGWLAMSTDGKGTITGSPTQTNAGAVSLRVEVSATYQGKVYTDTTTLSLNVKLVPPSWVHDPIVLPDAPAGVQYPEQDLNAHVNAPFGNKLTYSVVAGSGRPWATVSSAGKFAGKPTLADISATPNEWTVQATDGQNIITTKVQVKVFKRPPVWTVNPIVLADGFVNVDYGPQSVLAFVTDPDGVAVKCSIVAGSGPTWGHLSDACVFTAKAPVAAVGKHEWTIEANNGSATARTQLQLTLGKRAPKINNPITLANAKAGLDYGPIDLTSQASDPDGVKLEWTLKAPTWTTLNKDGTEFKGRPEKANEGLNKWTVEVSNGTNTASAEVRVTVEFQLPVWTANPILLPDATAGLPYGPQDLKAFASSPSGADLTFSLDPPTTWAAVSGNGEFKGNPLVAHVGVPNSWTVSVTDGKNVVKTKAQVKVLKRPPVWNVDPVQLADGFANVDYKPTDIHANATDPDGVKLTFKMVNGPAWGKMSPEGVFSGKPPGTAMGANEWTVEASNGFTTATAKLQVTIVNAPPVWSKNPIILPDALTGVAYGPHDLKPFATSPNGAALTISLVAGGPAWGTVVDGKFSGKPLRANVGVNTWTVQVTDGIDIVKTELQVTVVKRPPVWTKNPVVLPPAMVGESYEQKFEQFISDPDGSPVKVMQTSASPWVFVTTDKRAVGIPTASDLGLNRITVRATNEEGTFADVEMQILVNPKGNPPKWTTPTINLGSATVGKDFAFDLNPFVVVPSGLPVKFRKSPATPEPAWLICPDSGKLNGKPAVAHLGEYTTVFQVSDDNVNWVSVNAFGKVVQDAKPPVIHAEALFFTVKVGEELKVNLNQPQYVTSPDGLPLTFKLLDGKPWVELGLTGELVAKPKVEQLGNNPFQLEVTDTASGRAVATLNIKVIEKGKPPKIQDPIRYTATAGKPFKENLLSKVTDAGASPVFAKTSGAKMWLNFAPNGEISGTPATADLGDNFFGVSVTNSDGSASATVIVNVVPEAPDEEIIDIGAPVPGARVDNLWIVDNSQDACTGEHCLVKELKLNIDAYYAALKAAEVHSYGVYVATDACKYKAPIADSSGKVLLAWDNTNWVASFTSRVNRAVGQPEFNSPLVATWQFLNTAGTSIPAPFFARRVPMEALIVSDATDKYSNYQHWAPIKGWAASDYLAHLTNVHKKADKPVRVSALAIGSKAYDTLRTGTHGEYYTYGSVSVRVALQDYAKNVIFRANVAAKQKIKLTKTPADPNALNVTLAGKPLGTDKWKYLSATNEIEVYWHLIDLHELKPGDKLVIRYAAPTRVAKN